MADKQLMLDVLGTLERTHTCGELRESDVGKQVVLMGWLAKKRDFGVFTSVDTVCSLAEASES